MAYRLHNMLVQRTRRGTITASVEFKREDCWIGVFWRHERHWAGTSPMMGNRPAGTAHVRHLWICVLPMLPIHIVQSWDVPDRAEQEG